MPGFEEVGLADEGVWQVDCQNDEGEEEDQDAGVTF